MFYYGCGDTISTLELYDSRATITNCIFAHNIGGRSGDFYIGVLDASNARANTVITGNRFYDNVLPLSINANYSIDNSNTFQSPDGTQKNTYNGIFYSSSDNITMHIGWFETEVAFVIDDNNLWIDGVITLTLGNNVVIKFTSDSELVLDEGISNLVNHNGLGVYFTSFKDDVHKGDTNGDGDATSPANSDWTGIYNNNISISNYMTWPNILYDSY